MIRIGVVGTNWGRMHIGGFRGAGAEVVALAGRDDAQTRAVAAAEGVALATTSVRELCAAVDAVVVAAPDAQHREVVGIVHQAGLPVLCEKPLARTEDQAAEMAAWARSSERVHAVCFPYRMLPPVAALRRWLAGRRVRHLAASVANGFVVPTEDGAELLGASGDLGGLSHLIDAALWLCGEAPAWVQASLAGRPVHTSSLHIGLLSGDRLAVTQLPSPEAGIRGVWSLGGDGWEATFSAGYDPVRGGWRVSAAHVADAEGAHEVAPGVEPRPGAREPWAEAHVDTARAFLAAMTGGSAGALASFEDGLVVQRIVGAALRSEVSGRRILVG